MTYSRMMHLGKMSHLKLSAKLLCTVRETLHFPSALTDVGVWTSQGSVVGPVISQREGSQIKPQPRTPLCGPSFHRAFNFLQKFKVMQVLALSAVSSGYKVDLYWR